MIKLATKKVATVAIDKKQKVILWIDNEQSKHSVNCSFLETFGYKVCFAGNNLDALEKIRKTAPELVLLDLMTPGINGFQICGLLKRDIRFSNIPIIVISARFSEEDRIRAKSTGADAYIIKPFQIQTLLAKVNTLINGKKLWHESITEQPGLGYVQSRF